MQISERKLVRLAERIHDQLKHLQASRYSDLVHRIDRLIEDVDGLRPVSDRLVFCLGRGWNAACDSLTDRLRQGVSDLPHLSGEIERVVDLSKAPLPPVREILAELQQAQEEFETLRYQEDADLLIVTTEAIELEGVYLGEFEVQLHIPSLSEARRPSSLYRIVALDPHPAGSNDAVTHPHVSDEHLCEGDAGAAIQAALSNGRICDFFLLVKAVLTHYNSGSPYIPLDRWDGTPCYDCGETMGSDETYWCPSCDHDFCSGCISSCRCCDESICFGCLVECPVCGERVCESCLTRCPECNRRICRSCLENQECTCGQEDQENKETDNESGSEEPTAAPGSGDSDQTNPGGEAAEPAGSQAAAEAHTDAA